MRKSARLRSNWWSRSRLKPPSLTKVEMVRRMRTSRSALDRLLDPENDAITFSTLQKAAAVVGNSCSIGVGLAIGPRK